MLAIMGAWFLRAGIVRFFSDEPAVCMDEKNYYLHVNPGRNFILNKTSLKNISKPVAIHGIKKLIIGKNAVYMHTSLKEGFWASSILIGNALINEDIDIVYDNLINDR